MNSVCIAAHRQRRAATFLLAASALAISTLLPAQTGHGPSASGQPNRDKPAAKAEEPKETIRQEIATPMLAAEKLLAEKKYQAALDQITEAEKVAGKTPYELYNLDRMRAIAALGVGNDALAVKSLESAFASGRIPASESLNIVEGIARIYYRQKDYKQAAAWAARATREPGARIEMRVLLGHSAYLTNDFATAKKEIAAVIASSEKEGTPPTEDQLRLLGSASLKTDDTAGYVSVLEKLVVCFPNKDYWADLIYRVESKKSFAERLALDVYRLKLITGVMSEKADFLEMASLTLQSGYPVEAQKAIDAGIAAGALVKDTRVDSEKKLRESIGKELADENARAAKGARPAPKGGLALLNNGFDSVLKGDAGKGLEMMEAGIRTGDLRRPEDAKLRYGIALVLAGQKPKASEIFKSVQGVDGNADLAHLWDLFSRRP